MTRHAMRNSKSLSDLDLILAVVNFMEESLDSVYAKNKVRNSNRELTVAGQES